MFPNLLISCFTLETPIVRCDMSFHSLEAARRCEEFVEAGLVADDQSFFLFRLFFVLHKGRWLLEAMRFMILCFYYWYP